ncbi:MAG: DUF2497 domain-containing protein [Maricaulaceae bacterium]
MSEDTSEAARADTETGEPSMEDILASIRQIIADDETIAQPTVEHDMVLEPAPIAVTVEESSRPLVAETVIEIDEDSIFADLLNEVEGEADLEIPSMREALEAEDCELSSAPLKPYENQNLTVESLDLMIEADGGEMFDLDVDFVPPSASDMTLPNPSLRGGDTRAVFDKAPLPNPYESFEEKVIDPAESLLAHDQESSFENHQNIDLEPESTKMFVDDIVAIEVKSDELPKVEGESDLDLVKSLIAGLTDDSFATTQEGATACELISDTAIISPIIDDCIADSGGEMAMIDEVLDLTLDDELNLQEDNSLLHNIMPIHKASTDMPASSSQSLSAIADAARDDAQNTEEQENERLEQLAKEAEFERKRDRDRTLEFYKLQEEERVRLDEREAELAAREAEAERLVASLEAQSMQQSRTPQDPYAPAPILSDVTGEATASAFASLNQFVTDKTTEEARGDRIGDIVQEALKPMLREWLNENLQGIVERAVAKEVKRLASGN